MFAFLAMAGDLGGAVGPGIVGLVTQAANDNLKIGVLAGCVFPAVLVLSVLLLKRKREKSVRASKSTNTFHNFHT